MTSATVTRAKVSWSRAHAVPGLWLVVAAFIVALPWLGAGTYWTRQVMLIGLLLLITSGLNLSFGYAGELALGQAAMYAAGAYAAGWLAVHVVDDVALGIMFGVVAALVIGLISGIPGLRLGGWMLAITSFFLVLLIPDAVQWFPDSVLGGFSGLTGIPLPALFGEELSPNGYYVVVVLVTTGWFAIYRNLVTSRSGAAMLVMKQSPILASSLGISVYRLKLQAYALSAVPAGIAGALFANLDGFVAPESFTLDFALTILAASIIGGSTSVYGALVGAILLQLGPARADAFDDYALVAYGVFLVLGGVALSGGLASLARRVIVRLPRALQLAVPVEEKEDGSAGGVVLDARVVDVAGQTLAVRGVTKTFGGVSALAGVSFDAKPGQITALIGPNGSGKTTMLNTLAAFYAPNEGQISLGGKELVGLKPAEVGRLGVARTFQTPAIPEDLTVEQVLISARYMTDRVSAFSAALRLPSYQRAVKRDREAAREVLATTGLLKRRHDQASDLALGTRRMLELARVLAQQPTLILLDEVASGLDVDEVAELADILRSLRDAGATIVLVEHNFSLVRSLADHVVVLARGSVLAEGTPSEIEADTDVREHYLGNGVSISGTSLGGSTSRSTE